jgi:hypothetical protein
MRTISFSTSLSSRGPTLVSISREPSNFRTTSPSVPRQDGVRMGCIRHFAERLAAQSMADLRIRPWRSR